MQHLQSLMACSTMVACLLASAGIAHAQGQVVMQNRLPALECPARNQRLRTLEHFVIFEQCRCLRMANRPQPQNRLFGGERLRQGACGARRGGCQASALPIGEQRYIGLLFEAHYKC